MSGRTPEEREAARLERERRRAKREGRPLPPEPAPSPEPEPAPASAAEPEPEPASPPPDARRFEVDQRPENVAHPAEPLTGERPVDPQATQMFDVTATWTDEHAVVAELPASSVLPDAPDAPDAPELPQPPEPASGEAPLGTRRVAAHERGSRGRKPGGPPKPPRGPGRPAAGRPGAPRPGGGRRIAGRVAALLALLLVVAAGWFLLSLYQPGAGDGSGRVVVKVPQGAGVSEIGDLLADKGVIDSAYFFRLRAKLSGDSGKLKSGTFALRHDMSYGAALDALQRAPPPPPVVRITIPEGKSRREIVPLARQSGLRGNYLAASRSSRALNPRRYGAPHGVTLEGFLFPATYELRRGANARQLVEQQLVAFKQNLAKVNLRYARSKNLTVYDVLTIAAMVEREVAVARERPLVAAVIYNRLSDGMPLGIDATLRFELNDWVNPLKVSQLEADTPYNTRTSTGLPPGPIGNPGLASIEAAAHPAKVPYLFYVVKPGTCGEHAFSSTDAQFTQDVARYNAARDAAGGKSPTKC